MIRAACVGLALAACNPTEPQDETDDTLAVESAKNGTDIQQALSALNGVSVLSLQQDGTPDFIRGSLGRATSSARGLTAVDAKATVQTALGGIAPIYRLNVEDLAFRRMSVDEQGRQHLRFSQMKNGLPVIGGELVLHVDPEGVVYAANGSARGTRGVDLQPARARIAAEAAAQVALEKTAAPTQNARTERLVYVRDDSDRLVLTHEVRVTGLMEAHAPLHDLVYVDATTGAVVRRAPQIFNAKNRKVYSANNGTSLPGTLKRSEGQAPVSDPVVNACYDVLGLVYDCLNTVFGRDSYNNAGAALTCTTHYSINYVNAYWDGTQMVCGDGDGVTSGPLCNDLDVVAHEVAHAVTQTESNLTYSGESGGLNESFSDAVAAICESWTRGFVLPDPDVWKIGEDVWTPGTPGDALRYMDDPVQDGSSLDYYPNYNANTDVHYSSGIGNLAFALLAKGGTHPRGRTTITVPGIGVQNTARIWYTANRDYWTASTNFASAKTGTEQAALALGLGQATVDAVSATWQAVGVGVVIPPPTITPLINNVPVTGLSGSTGTNAYYKLNVPPGWPRLTFTTWNGAGDVDLYVKFGATPTTSSYDCRPYVSGNAETCTFTAPAVGDWYVMLNAYSTYSGVSLKGTYDGIAAGNELVNGVATAPYSGTAGAMNCWTLTVPAGKTSLVFNQAGASGTTGDADLYVRFGAQPTTTTYNCRPYQSGNTETCTLSNPSAGTWHACSRGYSAYTNVTMKGTY
jgi:vibriolysin